MTIGRNPHVAKAKVAEQKAEQAGDDLARAQAYRDAAHQWDRASEREKPGKMRTEYEANATRNRRLANGEQEEDGGEQDAIGEAMPRDPLSIN